MSELRDRGGMMSTGGQYGEPWRTMAPPNGGVFLRMGQDDLTLQSVQIFPKEKVERIKDLIELALEFEKNTIIL
jgi:hypothetical protein